MVLRLLVSVFLLQCSAMAQMKAHFIDVGQADATLLEFEDGGILIDAGGEATDTDNFRGHLLGYIDDVVQSHPSWDGRLKTVIITHPHKDHVRHLVAVLRRFRPTTLIEGGGLTGAEEMDDARDYANQQGINIFTVRDEDVSDAGLHNSTVDPLPSDPDIRLFGGFRGCQNENNDSVVVKVTYRQRSFLFTGDAETDWRDPCPPQLFHLGARFGDTERLDVDVYQVGHHASSNGTDAFFMNMMTPRISVISAGHYSRRSPTSYHAYQFGHPNSRAIRVLRQGTSGRRPRKRVHWMNGATNGPVFRNIRDAVYCTCWDGDVVIAVSNSGDLTVIEPDEQ